MKKAESKKRTQKEPALTPVKKSLQKELGSELAEIRRLKGVSQREVASAAGLQRAYIGDVENGRRNISVKNLYRIAFALGLKASRIVKALELKLNAKPSKKARIVISRARLKHRTKLKLNEKSKKTIKKQKVVRKQKKKGLRLTGRGRDLATLRKPQRKPRPRVDFEKEVAEFPETRFSIRPEDAPLAERAIRLLSAKWMSAILIELSNEPRRTGELLQELPDLYPKVLAERLKALQRTGLVKREYFREVPPRVQYTLTDEGRKAVTFLESAKNVIRFLVLSGSVRDSKRP